MRPHPFVLALLLALPPASPAIAELPTWAQLTVEGHRALARGDDEAAADAFCRSVVAAPFRDEDPRYAILLDNALQGFLTPLTPPACESSAPFLGGLDEEGRAGTFRAFAIARAHGLADDPRFLPIRVGLARYREGMSQDEEHAPPGGWAGLGISDWNREIRTLADLLEAHARWFAARPLGSPSDPEFGLEPTPSGAPKGSWLLADAAATQWWPRHVVSLAMIFPWEAGVRIYPSFVLDTLGEDWSRRPGGRLVGRVMRRRGLSLATAIHGAQHPYSLVLQLRFVESLTEGRTRHPRWSEGVNRLEEIERNLGRFLGSRDHPAMAGLLLRKARVLARHGRIGPARIALERAGRALQRPPSDDDATRLVRAILGGPPTFTPWRAETLLFGDQARAEFAELSRGGLEALPPLLPVR